MFSNNGTNLFKTVSFHLTIWYMALFGILSSLVFLLLYITLSSHLQAGIDTELLDTAHEFESLYHDKGIAALGAEFQREAGSRGLQQVFFRLVSAQDHAMASSDTSHWEMLPLTSLLTGRRDIAKPLFRTVFAGRMARILVMPLGGGDQLELGASLTSASLTKERYRETFGRGLVIMLVFGALFS